jgi:hypothetical protein
MAVWQFTLHLIPRPKVVECFGDIPTHLDPDLWEGMDLGSWDTHLLPEGHAALLDTVLPRMEEHWCGTVTAWGSYDGNIVEVAREDHCIEWFLVRIDLREAHPRFLSVICEISSLSDCYLLTEDRRLIPPQVDGLLVELKQSNAYLCVSDPQGWLESFHGMPRFD